MYGSHLYPNTHHFTLTKELPGCQIDDIVTIIDADGREALNVGNITMPIDYAIKHPEWFKAVTLAEYEINCKTNTIVYLMATKGKTLVEAELFYAKHG